MSRSTALAPTITAEMIERRRRRRVKIAGAVATTAAVTLGVAVSIWFVYSVGIVAVRVFLALGERPREKAGPPTDRGVVLRDANRACDERRFDDAERRIDAFLRYRPEHRDDPGVVHVRARILLARRDAAGALARLDEIVPRIAASDHALLAAAQLSRAAALVELGRDEEADAQLAEVWPSITDAQPALARQRADLIRRLARRRQAT